MTGQIVLAVMEKCSSLAIPSDTNGLFEMLEPRQHGLALLRGHGGPAADFLYRAATAHAMLPCAVQLAKVAARRGNLLVGGGGGREGEACLDHATGALHSY